jgi:putative endopeptidase
MLNRFCRAGRCRAGWLLLLTALLLAGACKKNPAPATAAGTTPPPVAEPQTTKAPPTKHDAPSPTAPAAQSEAAPSVSAPKLERFDASVLDSSKDPCVDFYAYACSKWEAAHPIPADLSSVGTWTPLFLWNQTILRETLDKAAANPRATGPERQVGYYWKSCMDVEGRAAHGKQWLADVLKPVNDLKRKEDLAKLLVKLHSGLTPAYYSEHNQSNTPFFGYGPSQDLEDASKVVSGFDQGGLSLGSREYYLEEDENSKKIREQFKKHLRRMFRLAGDSEDEAEREAKAVYAIENDLAKAHMNSVDRRDPVKTYHKQSLAEVNAALPSFNMNEYLKLSGAPTPPFYIVATMEFFPALDQQIKTRSLDEIKSYLRWWVIKSSANKTTPELEQANFDFFSTTLRGVPKLLPQWRRCVGSTDRALGEALGQEYVKIAFPPESKTQALEMVKAVREALRQDIGELDWMGEATKKQALEKLDAIIDKIGYPDKWRDYSSVKVVPDNYLANAMAASGFEVRRQLNKINQPVDKMEWYMTPPTINAYYDQQNNTINFPAGILQLPYFDASLSDAENYGSMGATVGHEITHGFDDQGRKFDAKGNLRDWWTEADAKAYEERGNCIAEQNTHDVPELGPGVKTNGKQTQGEDTADDGGIHLAMMALENLYKAQGKSLDAPEKYGMTARQLFYANYAFGWCEATRPDAERLQITTDPHSLNRYRVNMVVTNQAEFAKAFGCKAGQPMVKVPACRVW